MNYYKDLWTNGTGDLFFKNVNFGDRKYQLQEHMFRQLLKSLEGLRPFDSRKPVRSVLEVGAGTGRMTKIMLEELPDITMYDMVDIKPFNHQKIKENLSSIPREVLRLKEIGTSYPIDITKNSFSQTYSPNVIHYDMVLASEVFMHIKPSDLEKTMKRLIDLLVPQGLIINIDWSFEHESSTWCFVHNYDQIYRDNGLHPVFEGDLVEINQKISCYQI